MIYLSGFELYSRRVPLIIRVQFGYLNWGK